MTVASSRRPADAAVPARSWRTAWTPGRARLWLVAAAIGSWLPILGVPLRGWLDFSTFCVAGQLVVRPEATTLGAVARSQVEQGLPITLFVYPAGLVLLFGPR